MAQWIRLGVKQAVQLGFAGLAVGVVAGWVGMLSGGGPEQVGESSARLFPWVALAIPVWLVVQTALGLRGPGRELYATLNGAFRLVLFAAVVGSVLGTGFFFVVATNVPAILARLDPIPISAALKDNIGWGGLGLVMAVTVVTGLVLAPWANRQAAPGRGTTRVG